MARRHAVALALALFLGTSLPPVCAVIRGKGGRVVPADSSNCTIGVIETVAGTGKPSYSGDGGPAGEASLRWPCGIAVGPDGSLYIADTGNARIRKVDPNGVISTVAGGGAPADELGDGGPATEASLNQPTGLAVGPDGSLCIADTRNHRIRVVDSHGIISTLAGDGEKRYSGDGGPAIEASLNWPERLALGGSGLYIADAGNSRVRKVDSPSAVMTTVAGKGWCSLTGIRGDGGPATEAAFCGLSGVAVGPDGSLYIAERTHRVRRVDRDGVITTIAGDGWPGCVNCQGRFAGDNGPASEASFNGPAGLAVREDGSLFIADSGNRRIRKVDPKGTITTVAGHGEEEGVLGDGIPPGEAGLGWPVDVTLAPDGSLYIADSGNHQVYRMWWRPCDPEVAKARADELRAKAGDSRRAWREAAELYLIAEAWDDALAAAEHLLGITPKEDEPARLRAELLVARVYAAKRDDHEARRRFMSILVRARDPGLLRDVGGALVDLYLLRGERDQAMATLNDLTLRSQDARLLNWVDRRLKDFAGG